MDVPVADAGVDRDKLTKASAVLMRLVTALAAVLTSWVGDVVFQWVKWPGMLGELRVEGN